MKNTTIIAIVILIVIAGGFLAFGGSSNTNSPSASSQTQQTGEVQKITLGVKNYNYYPNTITVKVNQPVEITLDSSVKGCLRSFTIKSLGVSKYSSSPSEKIIFTPTQTGTFSFACSMGMGYGTIIVE